VRSDILWEGSISPDMILKNSGMLEVKFKKVLHVNHQNSIVLFTNPTDPDFLAFYHLSTRIPDITYSPLCWNR